jgi:hypothetical protein
MITVQTENAPPGTISETWARKLDKMEDEVRKGDHDGMLARWAMGQELLKQGVGNGPGKPILRTLAKRWEVGLSELYHRMAFARKFPSKKEASDSIRLWPSWYRMTHEGLVDQPRPKKPKRKPSGPLTGDALKATRKALESFRGHTIPEPIVSELVELQRLIRSLLGRGESQ